MNIEMDFSKLTVGDMLPLFNPNATTGDMIMFSNKIVVGGIMHLPVEDLETVLQKVASEFSKFMARNQESTLNLSAMLEGVKGL